MFQNRVNKKILCNKVKIYAIRILIGKDFDLLKCKQIVKKFEAFIYLFDINKSHIINSSHSRIKILLDAALQKNYSNKLP